MEELKLKSKTLQNYGSKSSRGTIFLFLLLKFYKIIKALILLK